MNCSNCNTPLIPGNNMCPKCGALNMTFTPQKEDVAENKELNSIENISRDFVEINDEDITITENMAPPALEVNKETSLKTGIADITNQSNVSIYAPEGIEEEKTPEEILASRQEENVNFAIPTSVKPDDAMVSEEVPSINLEQETIGEKIDDEPTIKIGNKKIKIRSKKAISQIICLIGFVVFFILGVFLGSTLFTKNVCVSSGTKKTNEVINYVADGKNNITKVGNYTFKIPDNYYYDKENSGLLVYSEDDTWRIYIKPINGLYDDVANAKTSIKASLQENSITVNEIKEIKVSDSNILIIETTEGVYNRLVSFMDAKNDYVYFIEIVTSDNQYNYDLLNIVEDIAKNAQYNEKEATMEKIKTKDIAELIITISEAHKYAAK